VPAKRKANGEAPEHPTQKKVRRLAVSDDDDDDDDDDEEDVPLASKRVVAAKTESGRPLRTAAASRKARPQNDSDQVPFLRNSVLAYIGQIFRLGTITD
jgi:hypothetical protein